MSDKFSAIVLVGPPGAGKGTQGKILGTIPGFFHRSAGDLFRSLMLNSALGRQVHDIIAQGELVPDALAVKLYREFLAAQITAGEYEPATDVLVLDGIPRTVGQAEMLAAQVEVKKLLHLCCPQEEQLVQRLRQRAVEQGREDDGNFDRIRRRFDIYRRSTAPLIDFYSAEQIAEIDPLQSPMEVLDQILHVLIPLQA
ncbi:MAG: adenylate kinase family protein [Candidatus Binatia bacterium]